MSQEPAISRRWTWTVGKLFGIELRVHATLLVLLAWIALGYAARGGITAAVTGVFVMMAVFGFVVLHELGHALVARRYGCKTRDIVLLPIGGIASLEHMPEQPAHELAVALAGPAVNVVLAGLFMLGIAISGASFDLVAAVNVTGGIATQLALINVGLAVFNLLPAFPMDGGRVLRALLAIKLGRTRATAIAARVGRMLAIVFVVVGITINPMLALIGVFVWYASAQESAVVQLRASISGVPVERAMIRSFEPLEATLSIDAARDKILAAGMPLVPVVDHGRPIGVVSAGDVAGMLATRGIFAHIGAISHPVPSVAPDETLDHALDVMDSTRDQTLLVVDHGALVGLLTVEQLGIYAALLAPKRTIASWG